MQISNSYYTVNFAINSTQNKKSNQAFKAKPSQLVNIVQYNMESAFNDMENLVQSKIQKKIIKRILYPIAKMWIKGFKNTFNAYYLIDENNRKIGKLMYSYPNKSNMHIDFIELDEQSRKIPNVFIDAANIFIKKIITDGQKKSISQISCLPLNSTQNRLYKKFGFDNKNNQSNELFVDFNLFKEKGLNFIKSFLVY